MPSVGCSEPGGGGGGGGGRGEPALCRLPWLHYMYTLKLYKWEYLKGQGGREERVRCKEGKGSRQRGGHPFPFSLALLLVSLWMIPRSRQLQQLSNSHLAHPPLVHYTPQMAQSLSQASDQPFSLCCISGNILGCATGAGKNIPSHASPPTISVCGRKNRGSFSAQVQLYPKPSIPMLIITATSPVFSLVAPSSHRIYSSYQQISPYNFYLSTQLFCSNTCLVHRSQ